MSRRRLRLDLRQVALLGFLAGKQPAVGPAAEESI